MPPKIKRNNIATISPEFVNTMCDMYNAWVAANAELIQMGRTDESLQGYFMTAIRLLPIVRRQSPSAREGLDYELTRFSVLPYTSFDVIEGPRPTNDRDPAPGRIRWLVGRTKHVTATYYNRRRWDETTQKFLGTPAGELGCYNVYIPETIATQPNLYHLHLIPQRNQKATARHYHHGISIYPDREVSRHPLSYQTHNCWGDYQPTMNSLLTVPDWPELFRQLHRHLCTYGDRPPFTHLDFDTSTPEA
jgi:hypothetical protein